MKLVHDRSDGPGSGGSPGEPPADDLHLLDSYSQAVVGVSRQVSPAVIGVSGRSRRGRRGGGSGSGLIISADGLALTNSHVAAGREALVVRTAEGDRLDAALVGDDPATDLALLRVRATGLPAARLETGRQPIPGQLAVALGSPFGLHSTVSAGIVSAVGRSLRGRDGRLIDDVVQHTAPINPGNSGGPLVDTRGQVMGINTAIIAMAQGLGFAVSAQTAAWVVSELLEHGRVRRLQLGIAASMVALPDWLQREADCLNASAVIVLGVEDGSPAARAGIQRDDLIVAIGGRLVESVDDIHRLLSKVPAGTPLDVELIRDERPLSARVTPPAEG